ncbi:MAG TPA: hypothetical protein HPP54_09600 [Nitrospinae bacterium]|jgi:hypothetical protein|nr:hypothetical protein [Nitrospinota bacterium]
MAKFELDKFMSKKIVGEYRLWSINSYFWEFFEEELKDSNYLFPDDFDSIVPESIRREAQQRFQTK